MLPMPNLTFRFSDRETWMLDELAADLGQNRAETVRGAIHDARGKHGQRERAEVHLIDGLIERYGWDATLELRLDGDFDVEIGVNGFDKLSVFTGKATVDGAEASGLYVPTFIRPDAKVDLYLGDLASDARIFVGSLPLRSGPTLRLGLADLHPFGTPVVETLENGRRTALFVTPNGRRRRYFEREDGTAYLGIEGEPAFFEGE